MGYGMVRCGNLSVATFLALWLAVRGVKPYERTQLLERVDRDGATVGVDIPDEIEIQGEPVDLQAFVFEINRRETVPPGERERVEQAKKNLRRERTDRVQSIESDDITYEEGDRLARSVIGIDRALNALESLGPTDLEAEANARERTDQKRWLSFLKQALGNDRDAARRGGR